MSGLTRRQLLSTSALVGSAVALGGLRPLQAKTIAGGMPWEPSQANAPMPVLAGPYQFFSADEAAFIDAAVARLIPSDDLGPGAKEAGVTIFLDRQLAGPYGSAARWYMQGPWREGTDTQGYQSRLTPAQLYRQVIKEIDAYCRSTYGGKRFADLATADQDKMLGALEQGEVELKAKDAKDFFEFFMQNTVEGFFSDPLYGGNRDMVGWKLIGFPGARYNYLDYVSQHGQRLDLPPVGIMGRPGWAPTG